MLRPAALALALVAAAAFAQDKKPDDKPKSDEPVKVTGHLPQNWAKLGLAADQKQAVYKLQSQYAAKIDKLKAEIEKLKEEEKADLIKVLTIDQRKKLAEIKTGEKPAKPDK